jgi:hypothetical protein
MQRRVARTARTVLKWVLIVLALCVAGVLTAAMGMVLHDYGKAHWLPDKHWVALGLFTALLFGVTVRAFRASWRLPLFWIALAALLVAHTVGYSVVIVRTPEWRDIWFVPLVITAQGLAIEVLSRLGFKTLPSQ